MALRLGHPVGPLNAQEETGWWADVHFCGDKELSTFAFIPLLQGQCFPRGQKIHKQFGSRQGYPGMMRSSLPHWSILGCEPCVSLFLLPLFPVMVLEASPVTTNDHGSLSLLEDRMFLIQSKFSFPFCSYLGILSQV